MFEANSRLLSKDKMPSARYFLKLKTAVQTAYQKALQSQELLKSGKFLLNRRNSSSDIVFSYSPCGDTLLSSQKSSRLPGSRSAPGDCSPLSSRAELRDLPRFDQPNRWSDHATDQGKALSMSGALSRTFAIPSVSGPSWQTCEYHTHLLFVDKSQQSSSKLSISTLTAGKLLGKVARQGCVKGGSGLGIGQPEGFHLSVRQSLNSKSSCQSSNLHRHLGFKRSLQIAYCQNIIGDGCYGGGREKPEKRDLGGGNLPYGSLVLHILRTGGGLLWVGGPNAKGFHDSSAFLNSARAAPDMTFDGSSKDDTLDDSQAASDQALLGDRVLKLLSGACYLPHPDKEETGGEDAHFICVAEQAIGVADGVGGWAQMGVNAGEYARELMAQSVVAIQEEPRGSIDLARVLEKAYLSTKSRGSSTACILALSDQGLHAVNLGDSGFLVVRDGCTIFRSPVQQHDFNFTFQLECGDGSDLPSSAQVFTLQVAPGDVIIAGTDGLFDNLYNSEVTAVVVHAVRAGLGPQITAQKIAALARQRAQDRHRQTPFSTIRPSAIGEQPPMGTFQGHVAHGTGILLVGLWHVLNTARNYGRSPSGFESRAWFPVNNICRHLELYAIACFTVLSIIAELVVGPQRHQPFDPDWSIPIQHMNAMEHATISMAFLVYALVAMAVDRYQIQTPRGLVHGLGALAFGQELLLFHFHSTEHVGVEGQYHWLLQLIVGVSLGTTLLEAAIPRSALVALIRSTSVFFQGIWLCHMGFVLWIPRFLPKECSLAKKKDVLVVKCISHEMTARAMALANLQFCWDLTFVVLLVLGILFYHLNAGAKVCYQAIDESPHAVDFHKDYSQD